MGCFEFLDRDAKVFGRDMAEGVNATGKTGEKVRVSAGCSYEVSPSNVCFIAQNFTRVGLPLALGFRLMETFRSRI